MTCVPPAYSAPSSADTKPAAIASALWFSRRGSSHAARRSSPSQMPDFAEHSVAMLHRVARSSGERVRSPGPVNSMIRSRVSSRLAWTSRMRSITSFAVQPGSSSPTSSKRIDSGTWTKVKPAEIRPAYSVAPTP